MMRTVTRRINNLENLLGIATSKQPCKVWVVRLFGHELALNDDRCVEILRECGFLPDGRSFAVMHPLRYSGRAECEGAREVSSGIRRKAPRPRHALADALQRNDHRRLSFSQSKTLLIMMQ